MMSDKIVRRKNTSTLLVGYLLMLSVASVTLAPAILAQEGSRSGDDPKRWQAVAPGRVEPWSGEIKVAAPVIATIGEVLVKPTDKVFAGELLIRLQDEEVRARLATAEAQVAMRKRARNDQTAANRVIDRRRSEDAVGDAERAVVDARAAIDTASTARRAGTGSQGDVEAARGAYARALDRIRQERLELRKLLNDSSVLQINGRVGELASPSSTQPLLILGNVSKLRVRAEVDERDFGDIKLGQVALVRTNAFRGREIAGKVFSIAPMVDAGRISQRGQRSMTDVNVVEVV